MSSSVLQTCFILCLLLSFSFISESSRLPNTYFEQMLPKRFPTHSSAPSKRTNSVKASSSLVHTRKFSPSYDGKV